jgi:glycosyltransferase involved in cell wall biosynthesis
LRDGVFVKTLKAMGHESIMLPIYLPLTSPEMQKETDMPVFYGAVNIYLKQNFSIFRYMPGWMERFFDSKPVLKYAAGKAGSTRATGLEEMTISMLKGSEGFQKEELQQLVSYLQDHEKPDIVHLSNALLLGLAEKIKKDLSVPVVCSLQDEDVWVDAMDPEYRKKVWRLMREKGEFVDAFIAVSDYFGGVMKKNLSIPDEKLHVVYIGVNPDLYQVCTPSLNPPVIGYLSRLCEENGFEITVDAFIELKKNSDFKNSRLRLAGGMTGDDKRFYNRQVKKLKKSGFLNDVEIIEDFRTEALPVFMNGLSVLSVPVLKGEAFGLYQLESLASGIPVVQPALGAFPEIAKTSRGGVIYQPNTPAALADALSDVFSKPDLLRQMSINGRQEVINTFDSKKLTEQMIRIYEHILKG